MADAGSGERKKRRRRVGIWALARVASVAAGVQFGWALQLSLLTPYVQELGIGHEWASYIWLCGPMTGLIMQPLIGISSDNCRSRLGRRRPFIITGAALVVVAVLLIAHSADLGSLLGDDHHSGNPFRPRAIAIFIFGFWILDLANNTLQGPCRALLADLTGRNLKRTRRANAFFSFFMAVGNVLGYAAGSVDRWYAIFPFTRTRACGISCANLKSAFMIGIVVLLTTVTVSITAAPEIPWTPEQEQQQRRHSSSSAAAMPLLQEYAAAAAAEEEEEEEETKKVGGEEGEEEEEEEEEDMEAEEGRVAIFLWELIGAFRELPGRMWSVLAVTALTWIAWFPFMLYDTDWMGRDVYGGTALASTSTSTSPSTSSTRQVQNYDRGVRMGSLGLMLQSIVLGVFSLAVEPLCRKLGTSYVWATANLIISASLIGTCVLTKLSPHPPNILSLALALAIFAVLGIPMAVTYSVPYALTATLTSNTGGGQGLSMGVLNMGVVIPQVLVSVGSGPLDMLLGGGNTPAFLVGAGSAFLGAVLAVLLLPRPPPDFFSAGMMQSSLQRSLSSPIP